MVGAVRFELTTSWTRTKRASQATLRPEPERRRCPLRPPIATLFFCTGGLTVPRSHGRLLIQPSPGQSRSSPSPRSFLAGKRRRFLVVVSGCAPSHLALRVPFPPPGRVQESNSDVQCSMLNVRCSGQPKDCLPDRRVFQFWHMVGTIINAAAILLGGVAGLATKRQLSPTHQTALRILLGAFTVYVGLGATWQGLSGSFARVLKQLAIVVVALILGNLCGKLLRIQKSLNYLGQYAKQKVAQSLPGKGRRAGEGFVTCSILFCLTPMAVLGSLQDGLSGNFRVLTVKAVMDGLAITAFVTIFGSGAILSVPPLVGI